MQVINLFFKCLRQCLSEAAGVGGSLCVYFCRSLSSSFPTGFIFFPHSIYSCVQIFSQTHTTTHTTTHTQTAVALRRKALINLTVWESMWEWGIRRETEREREILTEGGNTRAGEWWDYWNPWAHQPYSWVETCHDAARPPSRRWNVSVPEGRSPSTCLC